MPDPGPFLLVAVALGAAVFVVLAGSSWPHGALWCSFPVLMWPDVSVVVQAALVGGLAAVALLHAIRGKAKGSAKPVVLYVAFAGVAVLGWLVHGPTHAISVENSRNLLVAMLVSIALIPITAVLRPPLVPTLKALALAGNVSAMHTLLNADTIGGRAGTDTFNSDAIAMSAAATALAAIAVVVLTRKAWWLALAVVPLALFLSAQSRGALVVLIVGLALMWLLRLVSAYRVAIVAILLAATPLLGDLIVGIQRSLFSARDPRFLEVDSRVDVLKLAGDLIVEHPILGVGWSHFTDESQRHLGFIINPHNEYARVAAEGGLIAFVLLAALVARLVTFRGPAEETRVLRAVGLALATSLAFTNTTTDMRVVAPLWVLVGVAWAVDRNPSKELSQPPATADEDSRPR